MNEQTVREDEVWTLVMDGFADEECGSVTENGRWYGRVDQYIATEDSQGFKDILDYGRADRAREIFEILDAEIVSFD